MCEKLDGTRYLKLTNQGVFVFPVGSTVFIHRKTGNFYEVLFEGAIDATNAREGNTVVVYSVWPLGRKAQTFRFGI